MRNVLMIGVAAVIVIGFLIKMTTFTVSFTEKAVLTTFGEVGESGVVEEPGLKLKWPAPIQSVTIYDTRTRLLTATQIQVQLADNRQIVVEVYMAWRVDDPREFYRRFSTGAGGRDPREHYDQAEDILTSELRSAISNVSRYQLGELFTDDAAGSRLADLETDILEELRGRITGSEDDYGVEIQLVGISKAVLPADVTSTVTERMNAVRQRIAAEAESEGQAEAETIEANAESAAARIRAFVRVKADEIRRRGDEAAAEFIAQQAVDPELAELLKRVEFLRSGWGRTMTLVVTTDFVGPDLLDPAYLLGLVNQRGERAAAPERGTPRRDANDD